MEHKKYFPIFIANWVSNEDGIEINAINNSITFKGMDANTITVVENLCSGKLSLHSVIFELSNEWDEVQVTALFELMIDKQIIVDVKSLNKLANSALRKVETVIPNQDVLSKMNIGYNIIYGKSSLETWSCGKDESLEIAKKKLISELIEWNIWSSSQKVITSKLSTLDHGFVDPEDIIRYSGDQYLDSNFSFKRFNPLEKYGWLKVKNLFKNELVYVLAEHILFPYSYDFQYTISTSSGCAAHSIKEKVLNHALFEIIERDAFMIYWLNKLEMPILDQNTIPDYFEERILTLSKLGYCITIRDIGLDIAPVIFISVHNNNQEYITCSTASGSNAVDIIESALSEIEVAILHLLNLDSNIHNNIKPKDVKTLQQHEELHQQPRFKEETEFFFEKGKMISFNNFISDVNSVGNIVEKVQTLGFDVLELDASDWSIDILLPEFRFVSKVIVPGLVPLSYGYGNEPLGMSRIYKVPRELKLNRSNLSIGDINKFPHPFN